MCFFRCSCPRKKQILIYFSILGWKNSAEGFFTMQDHLFFLYGHEVLDGLRCRGGGFVNYFRVSRPATARTGAYSTAATGHTSQVRCHSMVQKLQPR